MAKDLDGIGVVLAVLMIVAWGLHAELAQQCYDLARSAYALGASGMHNDNDIRALLVKKL